MADTVFLRAPSWKHRAIGCHSACGPAFDGYIGVSNNCNADRDCFTRFGTRSSNRLYANDTAFEDFLTGAREFAVKEIEVFEIAS
jgi:hypothetical protein